MSINLSGWRLRSRKRVARALLHLHWQQGADTGRGLLFEIGTTRSDGC